MCSARNLSTWTVVLAMACKSDGEMLICLSLYSTSIYMCVCVYTVHFFTHTLHIYVYPWLPGLRDLRESSADQVRFFVRTGVLLCHGVPQEVER
jgi:hypothetical protein